MQDATVLHAAVKQLHGQLVKMRAAAMREVATREDSRDSDNRVIAGSGHGWGLGDEAQHRRQFLAAVGNGLDESVGGLVKVLYGLAGLIELKRKH